MGRACAPFFLRLFIMMLELLQEAFWLTATQLVQLIVPLIAIKMIIDWVVDILMGHMRND